MPSDAPEYPGPHGQPLYIDNFQPADNERRSKKRRGNLPKWQTDLMRSWYNAHVNNPYPTDEEKHMIMQETGLTIEQVSDPVHSVGQAVNTYHDNRSPTGLSIADDGTGLRSQDKLRPSRT